MKNTVKKIHSFSLSPDLSEWLKEEAWRRRISASSLVESLIIDFKAKESEVSNGKKKNVR